LVLRPAAADLWWDLSVPIDFFLWIIKSFLSAVMSLFFSASSTATNLPAVGRVPDVGASKSRCSLNSRVVTIHGSQSNHFLPCRLLCNWRQTTRHHTKNLTRSHRSLRTVASASKMFFPHRKDLINTIWRALILRHKEVPPNLFFAPSKNSLPPPPSLSDIKFRLMLFCTERLNETIKKSARMLVVFATVCSAIVCRVQLGKLSSRRYCSVWMDYMTATTTWRRLDPRTLVCLSIDPSMDLPSLPLHSSSVHYPAAPHTAHFAASLHSLAPRSPSSNRV